MNFFQQLINRKRLMVQNEKDKIPLETLKEMNLSEIKTRDLYKAIQLKKNTFISMIGDIKGIPLPITDNKMKVIPVATAIAFQSSKCRAISVNPDEFRHMPNFSVDKIKRSTSIPIISTELIVDEYQIYRILAQGFDALRLFSANMSISDLARYIELAETLNLGIICECVSKGDIDKAVQSGAKAISIRNIPVKLATTPISNSVILKKFISNNCISISHGNIRNNFQVRQLEELNYDCIMLDDFIIKQIDIKKAVKDLLT